MFIGTFEHTIDEKSRLTLPARFREALGDGVVLARGIDGNVAVYPRETWKVTVEARMSVLDPLSREARELRRFFFSGAGEADIDGSGKADVVLSFPGYGIWAWMNNAGWTLLHPANPEGITSGDVNGN